MTLTEDTRVLTLDDIRIRDPFVLQLDDGSWVLHGTTDDDPWSGPGTGFDCFTSDDLIHWRGPIPAFRPPDRFWGQTQFWAPEVHPYRGWFYMFATFATEAGTRGTQVLRSQEATGPFLPWSDGPVTPPHTRCLDGTFFVDSDGAPWMVFCREWLDVHDGQVLAQRLHPDLRRSIGEPQLLFRASDAPWTRALGPEEGSSSDDLDYVTDGPYLHRLPNGVLTMIWSSYGAGGYAVGTTTSTSGTVPGPWVHDPNPIWLEDGGHGMVLNGPAAQMLLVLHSPNGTPHERVRFIPLAPPTPTTSGLTRA